MKYTWIWCLCNTILIALLAIAFAIKDDCEAIQDQNIHDLGVEVKTLEKIQQVKDTVVVNVNTNVKVPSKFSVALSYPEEEGWIMDAN